MDSKILSCTPSFLIASLARTLAVSLLLLATGCNTLSSLGLPFGTSSNKLIAPAKTISEAPGHAILTPKELAKMPLDVYFVEIGDSILIEPVKFDATIRLPGDQIVQPDGYISLGEFGRVMVANKTIDQIQTEVQVTINEQLRQNLSMAFDVERRGRERQRRLDSQSSSRSNTEIERLRLESNGENDSDGLGNNSEEGLNASVFNRFSDQDQSSGAISDQEERMALERRISESLLQNKISVRLINWDSKKIYVLGEVNSPGSFTFSGNQTVLDGIIEAGGLNARANRHQIIVSRPSTCSSCRTVMKVCYDQLVQLGDASTNYQLQPGDRIFVPALTFCDDVRTSLGLDKNDHCPRCADCPKGCPLPSGCE